MLGEITRRTIALLGPRAWRSYGAVIAAAAVPFGTLVTLAQSGTLPMIVVALLAWCALVTALTAATFAARWRSAHIAVLAQHVSRATPRSLMHASIAASPALVIMALIVMANWVHPMLALALIPMAFVAAPLVMVATLLAVVGVVMGDRTATPSMAVALARLHPWKLAGGVMAAGVPILFASLPVACAGLVLLAVPGPFGWFGIGLALAAPLPCYGAIGVSAWRVLGGGALDAGRATTQAVQLDAPAAAGSYAWQSGPSWQFVLDAAAPWGTWLDIAPAPDGSRAPRVIGVTVDVVGVTMPRLLTCDEAGNWLEWPVPQTSGTLLPIQLPVGQSYVQLVSTAAVACHAQLVISSQEWIAADIAAA